MRVVKFRALCAITGVWRYGFYYVSKGNHIIRNDQDKESIVLSSTVGQFTGLKDKNGKEVYEGDYIGYFGGVEQKEYWMYSDDGRFVRKNIFGQFTLNISDVHNPSHIEVIGNIHEGKEVKND